MRRHLNMGARVVIAAFAAALISATAAGIAIIHATDTARTERNALIQFVCAAVLIQKTTGSSVTAVEYERRFGQILADLGENPCGPDRGEGVNP